MNIHIHCKPIDFCQVDFSIYFFFADRHTDTYTHERHKNNIQFTQHSMHVIAIITSNGKTQMKSHSQLSSHSKQLKII